MDYILELAYNHVTLGAKEVEARRFHVNHCTSTAGVFEPQRHVVDVEVARL